MKNVNVTNVSKAVLVGALASLIMFVLMKLGIDVMGTAPFKIPPSAAFLEKMGLNKGPLPLVVHFGYGATWSVVFLVLFRDGMSIGKAIGLAMGLWLFMMIVYSPVIGWGFFGFGGAEYPESSKLYLEPGPKYLVVTLVLHLIYGGVIGWLNPLWINEETSS